MQKHGEVVAWIVDDTGFPKQGKHSVGVARQYCGQVGKQDNCQVAVSLSVSTWNASLPIAWRLYLPEVWCQDAKRCQQAGVPEGVEFQTKPEIALQQIRQAWQQQVPAGVVLADAGYGHNTQFRTSLSELGLHYIGGIETTTSVWEPGKQPLPAPPRKPGRGATPKRLQRNPNHQPISVRQLALALPPSAWKNIGWRPGSQGTLRSGFAAVRVRPSHRDEKRTEPRPEEWLLIEWPKEASEPTKYWLSNLPVTTSLKSLAKLAKHRWVIERDYEELKQELGLGHYEGRSWRGFHPSRHFMYRCVWVPDGRAEPFFPLCPRRLCWAICPGTTAGLRPARFAASAPNDITHPPSPRCGLSYPANCSGSCLSVPSAAPERAVNLQHRRLLRRRNSVGGNGWGGVPVAFLQLHFAEVPQGNTTPVRWRAIGL
jgi:SRSO17 transposase